MENAVRDLPLVFVGIQAALKAGELLEKGFGTKFRISSKIDPFDLVTELDQAAEKAIISFIREQFPNHSFLAEESGDSSFSKDSSQIEVKWIIDPLDGTMNYAHQIPIFAVSIAAMLYNQVEIGILYQPMTKELFVAQKGRGAYLNGSRLKVSSIDDLQFAIGSIGFPYAFADTRDQSIAQFVKLLNIGNPIRVIGSAALSLAYVAAGRFDAYWGVNLSPWDVAAGKLIVEEAGGKTSHFDGSLHDMFIKHSIIASNSHLHKAILAHLEGV